VPVGDVAADRYLEGGRVEQRQRMDAAFTFEQPLPEVFDLATERRDRTEPCDDNASFHAQARQDLICASMWRTASPIVWIFSAASSGIVMSNSSSSSITS